MRVLHLNTTDINGGAARGAYWLHRALRTQGVESVMLVDRKYGDDDTVREFSHGVRRVGRKMRSWLDQLPLRAYHTTDESFWTIGWVPNGIARVVDSVAPDIVHLHWVGNGFVPIEALRALRRYPIVWTLRDMWAFTGGCHYAADCAGYRHACGSCPQLGSRCATDLSHRVWQHKHRSWHGLDLWLVPISNWLADCVRASALLGREPIHVIPNGVDTRHFFPRGKEEARGNWGLPQDKRLILYGAIAPTRDPRKGFGHLREAVRELVRRCWGRRAELVVFGAVDSDQIGDLGMTTHFVGHLADDEKLAQLYAGADVMVVPSLQEAFGKTLIEAMACGTPVVAFGGGGPSDIIDHRKTGYLARPYSSSDLAEGIVWCSDDAERTRRIAVNARAKVESEFDINVIADRYRAFYRNILARAP